MRYYYYKLINETFNSIRETVSQTADTNAEEFINDCIKKLEYVKEILNKNKDSLKSDKLLKDLEKIKANLSDTQYNSKLLTDELDNFTIDCETEINHKIKILFLAELGGKWDSMASVYDALKKRDDCEIDFVLTPIFRSNPQPDGTTKTDIIHEDWLKPLGIKHIPFQQFSIDKMRPDIIFTSQPYDSCTLSMFTSYNIVKYSRIVYLPYFAATTLDYDFFDKNFFLQTAYVKICMENRMPVGKNERTL